MNIRVTNDMIEKAVVVAERFMDYALETRPNSVVPLDEDHRMLFVRASLYLFALTATRNKDEIRWHLNEALSLIRELHPIHVHNGCERCQLWVDGVKALKAESA